MIGWVKFLSPDFQNFGVSHPMLTKHSVLCSLHHQGREVGAFVESPPAIFYIPAIGWTAFFTVYVKFTLREAGETVDKAGLLELSPGHIFQSVPLCG